MVGEARAVAEDIGYYQCIRPLRYLIQLINDLFIRHINCRAQMYFDFTHFEGC